LETPFIFYFLFFNSIAGFILLFFVLKVGLQLGNAFLFGSYRVISEIVFKKLSYFNYSGLVMFLANVVLSFVLPGSKTVVQNHQKFIVNNFSYFILYLCALEIAPLVIIGSFLKH